MKETVDKICSEKQINIATEPKYHLFATGSISTKWHELRTEFLILFKDFLNISVEFLFKGTQTVSSPLSSRVQTCFPGHTLLD